VGEKKGEHCAICKMEKEKGFYLTHIYICIDCERKIVETSTDHPLYHYYVEQLKKAWSSSTIPS